MNIAMGFFDSVALALGAIFSVVAACAFFVVSTLIAGAAAGSFVLFLAWLLV